MRLLCSTDDSDCSSRLCLLIVTGSDVRAETMDRPLAYRLRDEILKHLPDDRAEIIVVSDYRYLHDFSRLEIPTISIGGPGVNAVCQKWLECLPISMAVDGEFWIQMEHDECETPRASVWGVDHAATRTAIATFERRFLESFLCQVAAAPTA